MKTPSLLSLAAVLGLALSGCSVSLSGPDAASSSGSPQAPQSAAASDAVGGAQASGGATTGGAASEGSGSATGEPAVEATDITDATWRGVLSNGSRLSPDSDGNVTIESALSEVSVVGDVETLDVRGAGVTVAAEDVNTLKVSGSSSVVYVRSAQKIEIAGASIEVYWLEGSPVVEDKGAFNTAQQLEQQ